MPPLPGTSWLPTMHFSLASTTHLPPVLFLLVRLCPVLGLTCQPVSVVASTIDTKPLSLSSSLSAWVGGPLRKASRPAASTAAGRRRSMVITPKQREDGTTSPRR